MKVPWPTSKRRGRDLISDLAGHGERPCPSDRVGKLAEPLAEIVRSGSARCRTLLVRRRCCRCRPTRRPAPSSIGRLVRRVLEQLILEGRFEIAEARDGRTAGLADLRPAVADRTPKSSVMRFEISTDISSSFAGGMSPVFDQATVGSDISSATHGSSVASVAGKNRAPTKQWADALRDEQQSHQKAERECAAHLDSRNMTILHGAANWAAAAFSPP